MTSDIVHSVVRYVYNQKTIKRKSIKCFICLFEENLYRNLRVFFFFNITYAENNVYLQNSTIIFFLVYAL